MLAKPIPRGKIGKLAEAALSRDLDTMIDSLQKTLNAFKANIAQDEEIPQADKESVLREAIANHINKAEPNLGGQTVLHLTANFPEKGDSDLGAMIFLLKHGANPNAQDSQGQTLMHHYTNKGVEEAVAFAKKSKNTKKEQEQLADIIGHFMYRVNALAYYKGDPNLTNFAGQSPVSIMREHLPGLENEPLRCYELALDGITPPGKVEEIPAPEVQLPKAEEAHAKPGAHAAKVLKGRANNDNGQAKKGCVLQ